MAATKAVEAGNGPISLRTWRMRHSLDGNDVNRRFDVKEPASELFGGLLHSTTAVRRVRYLYYLRTSEGKVGLENVFTLNRQLTTEELYHTLVEINFFPSPFQLCAKTDSNSP